MPPEPNEEGLKVVLQAYEYALDASVDPWQLALSIRELELVGLSTTDIRWLLLRRFALLARETTIPGDSERSFRTTPFTALSRNAYLVLTEAGATFLRSKLAVQQTPIDTESLPEPTLTTPSPVTRPYWDSGRRELRIGSTVVKRFRVPARNQELILQAFEEEGWPTSIDDPLPPVQNLDCQHRLRATIKSLNRSQNQPLIRFHGNGGGQVIYWNLTVDALSTSETAEQVDLVKA